MVKKLRRLELFDIIVCLILTIVAVACIFPLLYVLSVSLTPYSEVLKHGGFMVIPRSITFEAYIAFLQDFRIPKAYEVTVFITVVGTAVNLLLTAFMAYALSKKGLPGRNLLLLLVMFSMLFSGGVIPTYLIVKAMGLINTYWAMILPNAVWSFNLMIMKTFFENMPEGLEESAKIDGAGELRILFQIVMPLSMPVMATVGLFYGVGHWNEFFQAIMYVNDTTKHPLQVILRGILIAATSDMNLENPLPTETLQMSAVILTALPILVVYPFIQKYFTQGMLIGAIKG
ncbi:MAG: transporter permease [Paenibacillaceae bacterium]|jgi:putative aldouronate transport system permease protein|nr:transporter permease [Paenibacillaceae bacterium]